MHRYAMLLLGCLACLGPPSVSGAQNPRPAPPQDPHPLVAAPNAPAPPPEQIAPSDGNGKQTRTGDTTLSDRLSRQRGTLQPPAVDPGIEAPTPPRTAGTMPVIPPPGTPGGDQKVVPK